VFLAAIEKGLPPLTPQEMLLFNGLVIALVAAAVLVYLRLFRRLAINGPQTRPDLLALPEILAAMFLMVIFGATLVARVMGGAQLPDKPIDALLIDNITWMAVPTVAIVVLLIARGAHLRSVFGLNKIGVFKALCLAFCLAVLALPLTAAVKVVTVYFTHSQEAPQLLVQRFQSAVTGGDFRLLGLIVLSACLVAPISEEILFRGVFYPLLSRGFGRGLAALATALFFAAVHDTITDVPGLTILALCFTLAYEVTGSLLVPIFMHVVFNSISLAVMWWQIREGVTL